MRDGAGPFALFFQPLAVNPLVIRTAEDSYAHNGPGKFEPHDITLVTGDAETTFAARLRSLVGSVFAGGRPVASRWPAGPSGARLNRPF
ncbi:hypothetical protein GCM10022223_06420 [Kineosporia mesophila]|uniref:Uncharacterized protein n=1 Tax=Kineosporia mesophila TaxID=566012 RepID=A0ABP6YY96_9ACTN